MGGFPPVSEAFSSFTEFSSPVVRPLRENRKKPKGVRMMGKGSAIPFCNSCNSCNSFL
jgi:hypothetical protein